MVVAYRSPDRILVLEKEDPKTDVGIFDPEVFTGKNNLHIVKDPMTSLWSFKYERGVVPPPLRNIYTSFNKAYEQASIYFKTKKIKIVAVKD